MGKQIWQNAEFTQMRTIPRMRIEIKRRMLAFHDRATKAAQGGAKARGVDWMGHTYIKNLDYARIFAPTNDRIKAVYNEKTGKRFAPHFYPYETEKHGAVIPGHGNSAERYFELCREYGVNPRFFGINVEDAKGNLIPITEHPGYLKLIKETARTDTPQEPIVAKFDMDAVNSAMKAFKGYANLLEDAYGIVETVPIIELSVGQHTGFLPVSHSSSRKAALALQKTRLFSCSYHITCGKGCQSCPGISREHESERVSSRMAPPRQTSRS